MLNRFSSILAVVSRLLSCFAIYRLSVSLVPDKLKEIAVHRLLGARIADVTFLLARGFVKQTLMALVVFVPIAFILLKELLRTFVYSTSFGWLDPVYPLVFCVLVIITICLFQAFSLHMTVFVSALKT